ncbi:MAG: hydroxyacid dehydrogenase [Rhodospirillales bacterium CG15_BIG_FIL_POST_REV_8_21_14_020_66_15]|nr:MAG: hydroxyacid dehydrogenase [Rhodospirillales bacterium CG15_BIG_FIL_POST_REV_8_21_14_020_66_15]
MTRIAILDDYQNVALDLTDWKSLGADVEVTAFNDFLQTDEDRVAKALAGYDVVVGMRERTRFPASQLEKLPDLKMMVTTGMRNLAWDMTKAREMGITVCGTAILPYPAFEQTWALIFAVTKEIPKEDRCMKAGGWQESFPVGLREKTLGVIGLGKLGAQSAALGNALGMKVIAWSENLAEDRAAECGATLVSKEALFRESDVVTIHVLLSDRTRGLVGAGELALMKSSAYLVNTSRGPIVDEAALIEALKSNRIKGAGLDVYDVEPLPADHELRRLDNAVLTGHTGYVIRENYELMYPQAVECIKAWMAGSPIRVLNADA